MIALRDLVPAEVEGWAVVFELADEDPDNWMLIGGQMMKILTAEHGMAELVRPTLDVDVVINVRGKRGGTEWFAGWLTARGFELEGVSPDGIGHRFVRPAATGSGTLVVDVLAAEGLGPRTKIYTVRPARTVAVPGSNQAFDRSELVDISVRGIEGDHRVGRARRPNVLGALIIKAAATTIAVRENPDRDWQDAALLLFAAKDPLQMRDDCTKKDLQRLRLLTPLLDRDHVAWTNLGSEAFRLGTTALRFLLGV